MALLALGILAMSGPWACATAPTSFVRDGTEVDRAVATAYSKRKEAQNKWKIRDDCGLIDSAKAEVAVDVARGDSRQGEILGAIHYIDESKRRAGAAHTAAQACIPPDRDGDGIPDDRDDCPDDPEDFDGFQDEDGCPEPDNDGDDISDELDQCPGTNEDVRAGRDTAEDFDGFQDEDGCPDPDNDGDGIPDKKDLCPGTDEDVRLGRDTREDFDGFQDDDGCPDPDNDGDGIPDWPVKIDQCPDQKETFNGYLDEDGCPDEVPMEYTKITLKEDRIELKEQIFFDFGSARIQKRSFELLDQVANVLMAHPEIRRLRIEGHTDDVGPDRGNQILSQKRAESVRLYLIGKGVDPARLLPCGYGESCPIASNKLKTGRDKNRRVEMRILDDDEPDACGICAAQRENAR